MYRAHRSEIWAQKIGSIRSNRWLADRSLVDRQGGLDFSIVLVRSSPGRFHLDARLRRESLSFLLPFSLSSLFIFFFLSFVLREELWRARDFTARAARDSHYKNNRRIGGRGPGGREAVEGEMRGDDAIHEQENYERIITRSAIATSPSSAPE